MLVAEEKQKEGKRNAAQDSVSVSGCEVKWHVKSSTDWKMYGRGSKVAAYRGGWLQVAGACCILRLLRHGFTCGLVRAQARISSR
ncbi:unnamed protein product [Ceratitis capitata]|uniref:(Mediterranean fruit fly) hypothetical protein n=1 Tax=Ceratitis capitata TaxID=7213 RepID=A0A811UFK7_CERCA|nr:unnamed protein product [Ceratitis capitata]